MTEEIAPSSPSGEAAPPSNPDAPASSSGAVKPPQSERPPRWRRWLRRVGWGVLTLTLLGLLMLADAWTAMGATAQGPRRQRMQASGQYRDGHFVNVLPMQEPQMGPMISAMFDRPDHTSPDKPLPLLPRRGEEWSEPPASGLRVTWLGHSTMLIEIDGRRVLTDPVWGERCSPGSFYGPARFHELEVKDTIVVFVSDHGENLGDHGIYFKGPHF